MFEFIAGVVVCYVVLFVSGTMKMRRLLEDDVDVFD